MAACIEQTFVWCEVLPSFYFEFEDSIRDLDEQLATLVRRLGDAPHVADQILALRTERTKQLREIYGSLTPWQKTRVARHQDRPHSNDLIATITNDFVELHGDRRYGDDRAIVTGLARINDHRVMLIGHRKGHNSKERAECNFGCPHPEGYRKALLRMKMAEKFQIPVVCLIDTAGAYPGLEAEERGQHHAIAENLFEMSRLRTPIICVVIGEGGSGGALGIGVGDRVAMFEHAYYSVISPEGCAGILWKDRSFAEQAATALKFTAPDLERLQVIDEIIPEPVGGAHRDPFVMAMRLKFYLTRQIDQLQRVGLDELVEKRYQRFRAIGEYTSNLGINFDSGNSFTGSADPSPQH